MYRYRVSGLALDSDIALVGLLIRIDGDADLRVRLVGEASIVHRSPPIGPGWSATAETVTLDIPGIVRMQAVAGRELRVAPVGGIEGAVAFVAGTGLGMLLQQRGETVLRGAAIGRGDGAVLLIGPAGVGVSTLAMALAARGCSLITDDLCRLRIDKTVRVTPSGATCQLRRGAIDRLGLTALAQVRPGIDRYHVAGAPAADTPRAIEHVFVLRSSDAARPAGIEVLPPLPATVALYAAAYRPAIVAPLGGQAALFRAAACIVRQASVHTLTVRRDPDGIEDAVARLESHWAAA